jgi:hypothetical protein
MAWRDWGNPPHNSSASFAAGASTSALIAALSTLVTGLYEVRWVVGGTSNAIWRLEHSTAASSAVAATDTIIALTGIRQSAEFLQTYAITTGDQLRARISGTDTGQYCAHISAERLT